jgi:hypothetical protein
MIRRAAVVVLMMLSTAATAQDGPSKADWDAINVSLKQLKDGRYLDAAEILRPLAFDAAASPSPASFIASGERRGRV